MFDRAFFQDLAEDSSSVVQWEGRRDGASSTLVRVRLIGTELFVLRQNT